LNEASVTQYSFNKLIFLESYGRDIWCDKLIISWLKSCWWNFFFNYFQPLCKKSNNTLDNFWLLDWWYLGGRLLKFGGSCFSLSSRHISMKISNYSSWYKILGFLDLYYSMISNMAALTWKKILLPIPELQISCVFAFFTL
jgi:hypothetical protein